MKFSVIALQYGNAHFGWTGTGYSSLTEAEMAKNDHVTRSLKIVASGSFSTTKGYLIISSDGSIHYYDSEGRYLEAHAIRWQA